MLVVNASSAHVESGQCHTGLSLNITTIQKLLVTFFSKTCAIKNLMPIKIAMIIHLFLLILIHPVPEQNNQCNPTLVTNI